MADSRSDLKFWLAFHRIPGIGRARFSFLEGYFRSLSDAWAADRAELRLAGLDERTVSTIISHRPKIDPDAELERLGKLGIQAYTWNDPGYPARLREVYEAPPVLYVRGGLQPADEWSIAVVGTRRASAYGRQAAEHLAGDLARNSITVVSGLARGVDAVAHRAALAAGGRTVAVLACGLDMVYPPEHRQLAREIMEAGALVSDYPPGTQPRSDYFPRRNRIMSGMSLGVLVIEAGAASGALHTVNWAVEQNREVFAVPGSIYSPVSRGTNRLIQEGAKLVTDVQDILAELNLTMAAQQQEAQLSLPVDDTESQLLRVLSSEPVHIDEVRRSAGLPMAAVSSALAMLELKGAVRQVGHMHYVRVREAGAAYEV